MTSDQRALTTIGRLLVSRLAAALIDQAQFIEIQARQPLIYQRQLSDDHGHNPIWPSPQIVEAWGFQPTPYPPGRYRISLSQTISQTDGQRWLPTLVQWWRSRLRLSPGEATQVQQVCSSEQSL
jgi:hypothetical protein